MDINIEDGWMISRLVYVLQKLTVYSRDYVETDRTKENPIWHEIIVIYTSKMSYQLSCDTIDTGERPFLYKHNA